MVTVTVLGKCGVLQFVVITTLGSLLDHTDLTIVVYAGHTYSAVKNAYNAQCVLKQC